MLTGDRRLRQRWRAATGAEKVDTVTTILVVEENESVRSALVQALAAAGYCAVEAVDGTSARSVVSTGAGIDLVVLNVDLPDEDGVALLKEGRSRGFEVPVIIVIGEGNLFRTVKGLDAGANDAVAAPFRVPELLARIRLRLREHTDAKARGVLEHDGMRLDVRTRWVEVDGRMQELTNREYTLLEMLLRHRGETLSRAQLLESIWGMAFDPGSNIVNVYIRLLRNKIGHHRVQTVPGVGYRLG